MDCIVVVQMIAHTLVKSQPPNSIVKDSLVLALHGNTCVTGWTDVVQNVTWLGGWAMGEFCLAWWGCAISFLRAW